MRADAFLKFSDTEDKCCGFLPLTQSISSREDGRERGDRGGEREIGRERDREGGRENLHILLGIK